MELKVPPAGESISTVVISEWLVEEGDSVQEDQTLVILETDKINVEVPSPVSGVLSEILKGPGQEADIGEVIAQLEAGAGAPAKKVEAEVKAGTGSQAESESEDPIVSPAARRMLEENHLSPGQVEGSGKGGRILKEDVMEHLQGQKTASAPARPKASQPKAAPSEPVGPDPTGPGEEEVVPMSPLRRKIAERLVSAQQTAAILTTFNEVDMSAIMELRARYKQPFIDKHGIKLGLMPFFVKASVEALKEFPAVNAEIRGTDIVYKNHYDIGVAVGTPKGLVVPVLRGADHLSLAGIELGIKELAEKARTMKLTLDDLQGGTFTISNGGVYGSMMSTPILNPPQSGILGLHNIVDRPVAVNGKVEIRPMMYLALSYDHRIIDGKGAVSFLVTVKNAIEDPARMLLEV
ncbi:MAG: 2-oxoglutarate dehydrogenase complex dihydrolipoyllysine-residue succinyltransferase [Vulcanimicrobiota bacterium]